MPNSPEQRGWSPSEGTEAIRSPETWVGPDIAIRESGIIQPGQSLHTHVAFEKPQWLWRLIERTDSLERRLYLSIRSVLAQAGLEVSWSGNGFQNQLEADFIHPDSTVYFPFSVRNYGARAIQLEAGDTLFRFFARQNVQRLEGTDLTDHVVSKGVVEGVYGQDWWFVDRNDRPLDDSKSAYERASALGLRLDVAKRLWIPPANEPLHLLQRDQIDSMLEPLPEGITPDFFVTEVAPRVRMSGRPGVIFGRWMKNNQPQVRHIDSIFVDPTFGDTYYPERRLRAEIVGSPAHVESAPSVVMEIW